MAEFTIAGLAGLAEGEKKTVKAGETEVLVLRHEGALLGMQAKCPHAKAPLDQGAVCDGRLVCPWHMATFALPTGALVDPPAQHGLTMYSVRGAGDDVVMTIEETVPAHNAARSDDARTFALVGCGAAGAMAAVTLRAEGFGGRIVAIDPVADEPVDRTQLSKQVLAGKMPMAKVKQDTLRQCDVERMTAGVAKLSSAEKSLTLTDGSEVRFDAALVATGGVPVVPAIAGARHAYTLRHAADAERILAVAESGTRAVVIGTSFIGLEVASALVQKGMHVEVFGRAGTPFAEKFGEPVGRAVQALHESKGVVFHLGEEVTGSRRTL